VGWMWGGGGGGGGVCVVGGVIGQGGGGGGGRITLCFTLPFPNFLAINGSQ